MMRKTFDLRRELDMVKTELEHYKAKASMLGANPLPKCESMACAACIHAVYQRDELGGVHLIGCGKERKCPDFKAIERFTDSERVQAVKQAMTQARSDSTE